MNRAHCSNGINIFLVHAIISDLTAIFGLEYAENKGGKATLFLIHVAVIITRIASSFEFGLSLRSIKDLFGHLSIRVHQQVQGVHVGAARLHKSTDVFLWDVGHFGESPGIKSMLRCASLTVSERLFPILFLRRGNRSEFVLPIILHCKVRKTYDV